MRPSSTALHGDGGALNGELGPLGIDLLAFL
jgi:hypothetical protein